MLTVPEYVLKYIDPSINLVTTPKICCLFHDEDTPSFSYKAEDDIWRCFGACKVGGDVIAMHQKHYHIATREEAKKSLYALERMEYKPDFSLQNPAQANEKDVIFRSTYARAVAIAKTIEDFEELDYIMGQSPVDVTSLEIYVQNRKVK